MHKDIIKVVGKNIIKPKGKTNIVYFSSLSNNTHKFIQKLGVDNSRIPIELKKSLEIDQEYVLLTPTYSGGGDLTSGAVPKQVIKFLNNAKNRNLCRGVIASGNTNFGNTFAMAGPIISKKLNVPLLCQFELLGTEKDVKTIKKILEDFWIPEEEVSEIEDTSLLKNSESDEYIALNASLRYYAKNEQSFLYDQQAVKSYWISHVSKNLIKFNSTKERIDYLVENDYYEKELIDKYTIEEIESLTKEAFSYKHTFPSFMGILKFYNSYALKTFDDSKYLEHYEDRVVMNALFFADGNFKIARKFLREIILGRFQPATPTFLNVGKKQRGEYVSCYLLRIEDNMESIGRAVTTSLQLSKRGGGVALLLTNLREYASPIKNMKGKAKGVVPVMKILEDTFSYANQLGKRQGAGAVYLNIHHSDVLQFLDTKRENADEKIRIKSLSLGLIVTNIAFKLAQENKEIALFSPYDLKKEYGKAMSDISITKEYDNLIANKNIKKTYFSARKLFQTIAELHFESGYPYLLFDDTVNEKNAHQGRIVMSNLCSEIAQVSTPSEINTDLTYSKIGQDISCNLGSLNIDKMMKSGTEFSTVIELSIKALDHVSRVSDLTSAPTINKGNSQNHAIGLGAMNLHGFLANNEIYYNSKEAVDFTNIYFYVMAFHAFSASNKLAKIYGSFNNFENSKFATGKYFEKYTKSKQNFWSPKFSKIKKLFKNYEVSIPTQKDWIKLAKSIKTNGLANSHLMAVAPTGSISYLSSCTPSLQPIVSPVEVRKEGKLGRIYVPAFNLNKNIAKYYKEDAYKMGPNPIIDIAAAAQQHVDQAISLTLFMTDKATTRDLNKAYVRAFKKGCASIYYVRVRQDILDGSESYDEDYQCNVCVI